MSEIFINSLYHNPKLSCLILQKSVESLCLLQSFHEHSELIARIIIQIIMQKNTKDSVELLCSIENLILDDHVIELIKNLLEIGDWFVFDKNYLEKLNYIGIYL